MKFGLALLALVIAVASAGCGSRPAAERATGASELAATSAGELAAALLAESNRVRREHGRLNFKPSRELDAAADDQAALMAISWRVGHHSPVAGEATVAERVRNHGLHPRMVAENVASTVLGAEDAPPASQEIAQKMLAQWMESPRHRQNLLSRDFTHLGGSVRLIRLPGKTWVAFGAQVFFKS